MKLGRKNNPIIIRYIKEIRIEESGRVVEENYPLGQAIELFRNIAMGSSEEVIFNLQDRNIILTDTRGNSKDLKHMWGEYICLPGITVKIPECLKPQGTWGS